MRPLFRDVVRVLRNPAILAILVLLLVSGTFVSGFSSVSSEPGTIALPLSSVNAAISYSYYSNAYHFAVVSFDGAGTVERGILITLEFSVANSTGQQLGEVSGTTDSRGLLALNWTAAPCRCSVQASASGSQGSEKSLTNLEYPPPVEEKPLDGAVFIFDSGLIVGRPTLLVAFADFNGTVPPGMYLAYCAPYDPGSPSECVSHDLGSVTSTLQTFPAKAIGPVEDSDTVNISLIAAGGRVVQYFEVPFSTLDPNNPSNAVITSTGAELSAGVSTMSLLVSLAGALIGYVSYGRERLAGSLDPVLALPISRTRLLLSRYSSAIVAATSGAVVGAVVLSLSVSSSTSAVLPASLWFGVVATLVAEAVAFVSIAFLGAHLTRSSPLLLVVLILLALVFTSLWSVVTSGIGASVGQAVDQSSLIPFSPGQTAVSIIGLVTYNLDGGAPLLFPTVTNPGLLAGAVSMWIIAPIAIAWVLFQVWD